MRTQGVHAQGERPRRSRPCPHLRLGCRPPGGAECILLGEPHAWCLLQQLQLTSTDSDTLALSLGLSERSSTPRLRPTVTTAHELPGKGAPIVKFLRCADRTLSSLTL